MEFDNRSLTWTGTGRRGRCVSRSQAFSLYGAQLRSKSCFSMDIQSPAADAWACPRIPGPVWGSPTGLAIDSTLHLFPPLTPLPSAGSCGPRVSQGGLPQSLELLHSPFLLWAPFKAGSLPSHLVCEAEHYSKLYGVLPPEAKEAYKVLHFLLRGRGCKRQWFVFHAAGAILALPWPWHL